MIELINFCGTGVRRVSNGIIAPGSVFYFRVMKILNIGLYFIAGLTLLCSCGGANDSDKDMDSFISALMDEMTLEEKLGQINLVTGGDIVTGYVMSNELEQLIRQNQIGGVFNVKGAEKILELQRIAVEESRHGIPLLVGADIIHGYETIFPIPLALSCSWDSVAVERMARISAIESAASGINWT